MRNAAEILQSPCVLNCLYGFVSSKIQKLWCVIIIKPNKKKEKRKKMRSIGDSDPKVAIFKLIFKNCERLRGRLCAECYQFLSSMAFFQFKLCVIH